MKKILCLDFDGVLHSYSSGWQGARYIPDPPVDGALDFLLASLDRFDVQIFSSRSRYFGGRRAMKRWLRHWLTERAWAKGQFRGFTHSDAEESIAVDVAQILRSLKFPTKKPPAHVTIDDRAITFTGVFPPLDEIAAFRPWNRKK